MDPSTSGPPSPKRAKPLTDANEDEPLGESNEEEKRSSSVLDPEFSKNRANILDLLDELGKPKLEEEFELQFSNLTGKVWNELDLSKRGQKFITDIGKAKKALFKEQLDTIDIGDIKSWDITLLASAIRIADENQKQIRRPAALNNVKALKDVRNEASHTTVSEFTNEKFDLLRDKSKTALMQFGYTDDYVDKALQRIRGERPVFTSEAPKKEFCGREGVLEACKDAIKRCIAKNVIKDKIVVIHGFGGMGKSQIGKCLAQRLRSEKPHYPDLSFNVIWWFDAQTEQRLKNGFQNLAESLGINHKLSGSPELSFADISKVYTHLSKWHNRQVLLIFDNAEQMEEANGLFGLKKYLDPHNRCEKPVFLVTSRFPWHKWVNHSNCIKVDELTADDTRTCLLHYMGIPGKNKMKGALKKAINSLLEITGGHPLGLSLIGSAMAKKAKEVTWDRSSWVEIVNAYLDLLRAKPRAELSEEDKYKERVKTICEYTMAHIDDGSSERIPTTLLGVVACLHPDYIELVVVQGICYVDDPKYERPDVEYLRWEDLHVDIRAAINLLKDYSLIDLTTTKYFRTTYEVLKIHRVVQKCVRDVTLNMAPSRSPIRKIRKFLRSKDEHKFNIPLRYNHVRFLLTLHEDTPTEPNPLDPSSIIELMTWLPRIRNELNRKGNRYLPRISAEAIGTRVLNEDEHNALELIEQDEIDWNVIKNRARALYGSTCLALEWLIEVCCKMIHPYFFKEMKKSDLSETLQTKPIVVEMSGWILQCCREIPEALTMRTPKNVLAVLGIIVSTGEKTDHEIINRVFLKAGFQGFWEEYYEVYRAVPGLFNDEWLSGLFPPSATSFFTQSFQLFEEQQFRFLMEKACFTPKIFWLLKAASEKPNHIAQLLKETDGSDCAFWKVTDMALEMYPPIGLACILGFTGMWLRFFRGDENVYNSYGDRMDTKFEVWYQRYLELHNDWWKVNYPMDVKFVECAFPLQAYYTERTKNWIKKLTRYLGRDDVLSHGSDCSSEEQATNCSASDDDQVSHGSDSSSEEQAVEDLPTPQISDGNDPI